MVPPLHKINKLERVATQLHDDMVNGVYHEGQKLPLAKELASRYQASEVTVKRALRHLSDAGLLRRVSGQGTFVAEAVRGEGRRWRIGILSYTPGVIAVPGMISESGVHSVFNSFYEPAEQCFRASNCEVRHLPAAVLDEPELLASEAAGLDGLLVSHSFIDDRSCVVLQRLGKPVVTVQHSIPEDAPFCQVIPDFQEVLARIVRGLVASGRQIVLVSRPGIRDKEELFLGALSKLGVAPEDIKIENQLNNPGDMGQMIGYRLGQKLMKELEAPVIFSTSDFLAFGIAQAFMDSDVPLGAFPLVSVDDLEGDGLLPFERPVLTTVRVPRRKISNCAAELLLDCIHKPQAEVLTVLRIKTELVIRESSGTVLSESDN